MIGRVVSTKTKNTAVVLVEGVAVHPLYKKTYAQSKRYLADTNMTLQEGDIVSLVKVRPVSKNKHWRVEKVIGKDLAEIVEAKQKEAAEAAIAEVLPAGRQVMPEEEEEVSNQNQELSDKKEVKKEGKNKKA